MATPIEERKQVLLEELYAQAESMPEVSGIDLSGLIRDFYRHVAAEDLIDRSSRDLGATVLHQLNTAGTRPQGTTLVKVFTPETDTEGWTAAGHTVVEVVTDDMPFLVDSVTMALEEAGHEVQVIMHPQFVVRRGLSGELVEVLDDATDTGAHDVARESWMHVEIPAVGADDHEGITQSLIGVLDDVRHAVEDWPRMQYQMMQVVEELETTPPPLSESEVAETAAFLRWLADNHFTFLGYREYDLVVDPEPGSEERSEDDGDEQVVGLRAVPGTGYGILRFDPDEVTVLPALVAAKAREKSLLVLAKANSRATVHRSVHLDYVGVKRFGADGEVDGERRFLGLLSSSAYAESVNRIPMLREKAQRVIALAGYEPMSHAGKAVMDVLETYPRDELFQTPAEDLVRIADAVASSRDRRQLRLFCRRDTYGRYLSCLVYLPRDRYNTRVRERFAQVLEERLGAETVDYTARVSESFSARLHFVARPPEGEELADVDTSELERDLAAAARSWTDELGAALIGDRSAGDAGDVQGATIDRSRLDSFPEAYKEDYDPATGAEDLRRLVAMGDDDVDFLLTVQHADPTHARLKIFRTGGALTLSRVLPVLSAMGVEIVDERPYELDGMGRDTHVYDFGLEASSAWPEGAAERFVETVRAVWDDRQESDGFNALVLAADLSWRQVSVLRAYARYLRQGRTPYSQEYLEETLASNVDITRLLVSLFETRFDPAAGPADDAKRESACVTLEERINRALDDVAGLDQDRILRSYRSLINATLRTTYFQADGSDGTLAFKLDPSGVPGLPQPLPKFEIFVCSPRLEGVHLRFGSVARGGLRWSDRRDDFRTEVLGLVKAQMVKNTVIVPVGAKGGFVCKQLPDAGERDAWLAEGVACYRAFINALLDLTDNLVETDDGRSVVPPEQVVRFDGDDTYLVVAADKGTATFSDIANEIAVDRGFWLGDAFASGGSVGYDHKAMGITARGAWVSVQRHFRERGIDCQTQDFTAVGIGDMSGDVFGNGMLCSEHTRLVAAFDHRDIFVDPDPDAATSYAERRRLFELPRSSWQDYDKDLISSGGGVFSRSAKTIPVSAAMRTALGIDDEITTMAPPDLMRAILLAPVDLFWNGGIGTYVKASTETDADAGDKANDAIRVDGVDLRCAAVGEGGNLGLTQRGRIEYARQGCDGAGGRINTDFIDNSAGVDTSDHEVNIKILLDRSVAAGDLGGEQRNELLASMTDEVGRLVLEDNYDQNLALANAEAGAPALAHVHEHLAAELERTKRLNRTIEAFPTAGEMARRIDDGEGLSGPELSVLLSYVKIVLADELAASDIAEDPYLRTDLFSYFPREMRQDYRSAMESHPLRTEIIVTCLVNDLVNGAGITYLHRLGGETGANVVELTRANFIAREVFGTAGLIEEICSHDNQIDAAVQTRMRLEVRTLVERVSRWLVNNRRAPLDSDATVDHFDVVVQRVLGALPELLIGRELAAYEARRDQYVKCGVPPELAGRVAAMPPAYMVINIVETASRTDVDPLEVARVHFALAERLDLPLLIDRILALPRTDRWQTMARASLRDDLHTVHAQLTAQVIEATPTDDSAADRVAAWESEEGDLVERSATTLSEICADDGADLARLSVALRIVRSLLA